MNNQFSEVEKEIVLTISNGRTYPIKATVIGVIAVHYRLSGNPRNPIVIDYDNTYQLTHVPTGKTVGFYLVEGKKEAITKAHQLAKLDWSNFDPLKIDPAFELKVRQVFERVDQKENKMNNQYLLFAGQDWYPNAAWKDFVGAFDSKENAFVKAKEMIDSTRTWYQIVDLSSLTVVAEYGKPFETNHAVYTSTGTEVVQETDKDLWLNTEDLWETK